LILTDREIVIALGRGLIIIDPRPKENYFASTSVDLTLDPILTKSKTATHGLEIVIDPSHVDFSPQTTLAELTETLTISNDGILIPPKILFLAWTNEYVELITETRVAARVEGKSSLARLGLGVHVTAPTIHAGFKGRIRLELSTTGPFPFDCARE
jgi:dCTP deaminase